MVCPAPVKSQDKGSDHKNIFILTQHMDQAKPAHALFPELNIALDSKGE
jgi:hypothetical protein